MKKKLYYSEILAVYSREKNGLQERLQARSWIMTPIEQGFFRAVQNGIELPKRKRGQKFIVRYTSIQEKEL